MAGSQTGSCTIPTMFERTALASGPRVISAQMPGARSVSIAAYVLAGSRLETDAEAGVAHFMEHLTFKGTSAYPSTRAISEAIEGVGGSFNAATDRESTVYWVRVPRRESARAVDVLGELIVRPTLATQARSRTSGRSSSRRSAPTSTTRRSTARSCSRRALFGDGPLGPRDLRRRGRHPGASGEDHPLLLAHGVPAREHGRGRRRRPVARGCRRPRRDGVRDRQRQAARVRARAGPAGRAAGRGRQARHGAGPAVPRAPGPPSRSPRQLDARGPQCRAGRRDEQPALPVGARGAGPRL